MTIHGNFEKLSVAVAVNVHLEPGQQVYECLTRISSNLPGSKVLVILNGAQRPEVLELARAHGFMTYSGENLGTNHTWHLWWLRMLDFFIASSCDVCLKLDPDTMVDRTPATIPDALYFGDVHYNAEYDLSFVQGGITGFSRDAVHRILESQLLVPGPEKGWFTVPLRPGIALADDQLLAAALKHLDILPVFWSECKSRWRLQVVNVPLIHAIVHPRYY